MLFPISTYRVIPFPTDNSRESYESYETCGQFWHEFRILDSQISQYCDILNIVENFYCLLPYVTQKPSRELEKAVLKWYKFYTTS